MNWEKEYDKLWERATEPNKASKLMIKDFIFSLLEEQKKELLEKIIEGVQLNHKGTFTDAGGNNCWYIDDLVKALKKQLT